MEAAAALSVTAEGKDDADNSSACEGRRQSPGRDEIPGATPSMVVEDQDLSASFDSCKWTVSWKWKDRAPKLANTVEIYQSTLNEKTEEKF